MKATLASHTFAVETDVHLGVVQLVDEWAQLMAMSFDVDVDPSVLVRCLVDRDVLCE